LTDARHWAIQTIGVVGILKNTVGDVGRELHRQWSRDGPGERIARHLKQFQSNQQANLRRQRAAKFVVCEVDALHRSQIADPGAQRATETISDHTPVCIRKINVRFEIGLEEASHKCVNAVRRRRAEGNVPFNLFAPMALRNNSLSQTKLAQF